MEDPQRKHKLEQPHALTPQEIESWPYILIELPNGQQFRADEDTWERLSFMSKMKGEDIRMSHLIKKYSGEFAIVRPDCADA